jgi:predicted nuclease of restriction endonuclease-like (RecB) superfamily
MINRPKKNKDYDKKQIPALIEPIYGRISTYIENARSNIQRSINIEMVKAYWLIGRDIVEEEQKGEERAEYGKELLKTLAAKLQAKYNKGFGPDTLEQARKFYLIYQNDNGSEISDAVNRKFESPQFESKLSWTHYRELIRIPNPEARKFYEIEAAKSNWSTRELIRQRGSLLFERLNKNKDGIKKYNLSKKGQEILTARDVIKDPIVLEFLGLPESHLLVESNLENALINNLQKFLMELGKGFAFVGRQKRLTLNGTHYYADLVFYHVILKCYIIVDIKTKALNHGDLGQIQLYVNYFDQEIKTESDNPTIGLVLCTEKCDFMVKYTLGDKAKQIFASKYQFHLPTEAELEAELKREINEIKILENKIK